MTCPDEEATTAKGRYAAGAALLGVLLGAEALGDVAILWLAHPAKSGTACETLKAQPLTLQTPHGGHGEPLPRGPG